MMHNIDKVRESNRIEGILRDPTTAEIKEHKRFMEMEKASITELERFVRVYQPDAVLRSHAGFDVRVGAHVPPRGGPHIVEQLQALLDDANAERFSPWEIHLQYETLHPFMDGNGRSGRALWYWMMVGNPHADLGFLHAFYYQTLQGATRKIVPSEFCEHGWNKHLNCPACAGASLPTPDLGNGHIAAPTT